MPVNELAHHHVCSACRTRRDCDMRFCLGLVDRHCWPCKQRGCEDPAPVVLALARGMRAA